MQMHLPPNSAPMMQPNFPGNPSAFNMQGMQQHPGMGNPPPSQMGNFGSFNPMASFNNLPSGNVLAGAVGAGIVGDPSKNKPQQQQQSAANNTNKSIPDHSNSNDQQNDRKGKCSLCPFFIICSFIVLSLPLPSPVVTSQRSSTC